MPIDVCVAHNAYFKQFEYRTVLISPRYANFFDPLAVCREQIKYLSEKGLAKLAM